MAGRTVAQSFDEQYSDASRKLSQLRQQLKAGVDSVDKSSIRSLSAQTSDLAALAQTSGSTAQATKARDLESQVKAAKEAYMRELARDLDALGSTSVIVGGLGDGKPGTGQHPPGGSAGAGAGAGAGSGSGVAPDDAASVASIRSLAPSSLSAAQFDQARMLAERHPSMTYPGFLKQQFLDMLIHRVFVLMSGSKTHPYDGYMHYAGENVAGDDDVRTLAPQDKEVLRKFGLLGKLFTQRGAKEVSRADWRSVLETSLGPKLLLGVLMMALTAGADLDDLNPDVSLFRSMKERRLPLVMLYKALFFHLSAGKTELAVPVMIQQMAWAVLSMYSSFDVSRDEHTPVTLEEWEAFFKKHLLENSPEAHKLLLSSLVRLSGLSLDQIQSAPSRTCYTLECSVM